MPWNSAVSQESVQLNCPECGRSCNAKECLQGYVDGEHHGVLVIPDYDLLAWSSKSLDDCEDCASVDSLWGEESTIPHRRRPRSSVQRRRRAHRGDVLKLGRRNR